MIFRHTQALRSVMMSSTLTGQSGRLYIRDKLLQAHPTRRELDLYHAS
jgi:hypothetical protein